MTKKLVAFIVSTFLFAPLPSLAQSPDSTASSIENLNVADIAADSIVVLSKEETGVAGYFHQQFAFLCFGELRLIDYYGVAIDPKDENVLRFERQMCSKQHFADDGSED
jgi:hypothetical protein